jgi:copper chaperone
MRHLLRSTPPLALALAFLGVAGCAGTKAAAPSAAPVTAAAPTTVGAATAKVSIPVEGMTCGCCVRRVTEALEAVSGVSAAEVLLAEKRAVVSYDPARVQPAALVDAIRASGYDPGAPAAITN